MSWAESKWVVDTLLQKIGQRPNSMRKFNAVPLSNTSIGLTFLEPEDSYSDGNLICSVGGVMIRKSDIAFPTNPNEGELVLINTELGRYETEHFVIDSLVKGKTYYFSAFPFSTANVYNTSSKEENRETCIPTNGESVKVSIDIDNPSEFNTVLVKCVDDTEPALTQVAQLTSAKKLTSFIVPVGHTYHIEYGDIYGYEKPKSTSPKVATAGIITSLSGLYKYFAATIQVTYLEGAVTKCTDGETTYTAPDTGGKHTFIVRQPGYWSVTSIKDEDNKESTIVQITENGQSIKLQLILRIYGISRAVGSSSPNWERIDGAIGKTATASVGTQPGRSDFDNCYPWSEMKRQNIGSDVMVKIPEFWFKRYVQDGTEYIKIADKQTEGFTKHPGSGRFVGAYKTSSNNRSVKNAAPTVNQTRATMRNNAKSKGSGWGLIDLVTESAIQMLFLVEFATNNSQAAIGRGYCDGNSSALSSGSCDNVPGLTGRPAGTDGKVDVVYRGIEGIWGNIFEWVDGINIKDGEYYVCSDPTKYVDDIVTHYTKLNYKGLTNSNWITAEGMDNDQPWAMLPSAINGGSESTYYADYVYASTGGWYVGCRSGHWSNGSICGLFFTRLSYSSSNTYSGIGSRLLYVPS